MTRRRHLVGLLGTLYLVGISLAGRGADRRAGGGLPERVRARQLVHPRHQPGGGQPRRRAQHRARAVRPRRLRARSPRIGRSILAASLTLAIMTLPVIIASTQARRWRRCRCRSARPAGTWAPRAGRPSARIVLPNSISGILTGVILQGQPRRRRDGARSCSPARSSSRRSREGDLFPYGLTRPVHGAVDAPVHARDPGDRTCRRRCPTPPRWCCSARCCWSTPPRSRCACYLRSRKKW